MTEFVSLIKRLPQAYIKSKAAEMKITGFSVFVLVIFVVASGTQVQADTTGNSGSNSMPPLLESCPSGPTRPNQYLQKDQDRICLFRCQFGTSVHG